MTRLCQTCQTPISALRLEALPTTQTCVACSTEEPLRGSMVWEHKTAPSLEVQTSETFETFRRMSRKGMHASLPLQSPTNPRLGNARGDAWENEATRAILREIDEPDTESINVRPSKCHPDKPRINPRGDCVDCAVAWYERRR